MTEAALTVRMRRGIPTRVEVGGTRCRFGINSWRIDDQLVHFTTLCDGELSGFDVRLGDRVDAAGREWTVTELDVPDSGDVTVRLDEVAGREP